MTTPLPGSSKLSLHADDARRVFIHARCPACYKTFATYITTHAKADTLISTTSNASTELAVRDALTGLLNEHGFRLLVEHELIVARRLGRVDALLVIDVDDLKSVNEAFGREGGDETLNEISRLLQRTARESDIVARLGNDEFAIYALDCVGSGLGHRISGALAGVRTDVSAAINAHVTMKEPVPIRIRVGITEVDPGEEYDALIARAGPAALVNAKPR